MVPKAQARRNGYQTNNVTSDQDNIVKQAFEDTTIVQSIDR